MANVTSSGSLGILTVKALFTTGAFTMRRFFSWSQALKMINKTFIINPKIHKQTGSSGKVYVTKI